VIASLGQPGSAHVNFRDSKLTRILQPSLSGNAHMAVICCATPSELYLEETSSTLQFASWAKLVKTKPQVNEVLDDSSLIKRLQHELAETRKLVKGKEHFAKQKKRWLASSSSLGSLAVDRLSNTYYCHSPKKAWIASSTFNRLIKSVRQGAVFKGIEKARKARGSSKIIIKRLKPRLYNLRLEPRQK
jgi:hypothetical protein